MLRVGAYELCDRSDLVSQDTKHANQPKPAKSIAESKFALKNTKKQMSWIKLCESMKSWQKYHSENLSPANFASRKT
ncbi:hypothetical protein GCM10011514_41150 [Emticicia aquatilis]|uniref:Uncharacterized protein n=1 Tax=Emticicia aquatilis TaxID=1537369 RepID=A0A917DVK6_9BACT|nr:hypothetical protein [Emticicia aquatilis]GGD72832.1 hypothetical protein GCM10011514_41150 [Emticicia aquatilis]